MTNNADLYIGRMVRELLKDGGSVTIEYDGLTTEAVLFSYRKTDWRGRSCFAVRFMQMDEDRDPLGMADYDAERIIQVTRELRGRYDRS